MHSDIDSDFSTRSGIFTAASEKITIELNAHGEYEYHVNGDLTADEQSLVAALDGLRHADEDEIARSLYGHSEGVGHDDVIGYYAGLYCGYAAEGDFRANGSSGGITSWLLLTLLEKGMVDGVIAASRADTESVHFEYRVLRTAAEIRNSAKSRYYPMEFSSALAEVRNTPGRYALVGIPSFISDVRRLQRVDPIIAERIVFTVALLCGHQKSTKYGEAIAFEAGFRPGDVTSLDFRYKAKEGVASGYVTEVIGTKDAAPARSVRSAKESYVTDWSAGMFKTNFSDFVDDCFGETADITLGDAWIPPYIADPRGTNVVVVREARLAALLEEAVEDERLTLDRVDVDTVKASQTGLIRHYRGELPYRLSKHQGRGIVKRVQPSTRIPLLRRRVQDLRLEIALKSKEYYAEAVARSDWDHFTARMAPLLHKYRQTYRLIRLQNLGVSGVIRRLIEKRQIRAGAGASRGGGNS